MAIGESAQDIGRGPSPEPLGPQLVPHLDELLERVWHVAQVWALGPGRSQICVREFVRGMIYDPDSWRLMERDFQVDFKQARELVSRDADPGSHVATITFTPSNKLRKLLHYAATRALDAGKSEVSIEDVVTALWDMPGEESLCEMFPAYRARCAAAREAAERLERERAVWQALARELPGRLQHLADGISGLNQAVAMTGERQARLQSAVDDLRLAAVERPAVDALAAAVAQVEAVARQAGQGVATVAAQQSDAARSQVALADQLGQTRSQVEAIAAKLDQAWWKWFTRAGGTG